MAKSRETQKPAEAPAQPVALTTEQAATAAAAQEGATKTKRPGVSPRRGKKLREKIATAANKVDKAGTVTLRQAIVLLKSIKRVKFDETIEIHLNLGIDTTQQDQNVRGSTPLPHGIGKVVRVLVFCQGENVNRAKEAGADFAGGTELIAKIQGEGWVDFDVAIATQDMMGQVARLGKILGPRGLMPAPKAGTVVPAAADVGNAVREFKAGKVEYRADKGGNVHAGVGKMTFDEDKLVANITTFVDSVRAAKPSGVKGNYVNSITVSATMSPGVRVNM